MTLRQAGLHINPKWPYLGASPDGVLNCSCCGDGIVEIKCPHCAKDDDIKSATQKKNFCVKQIGDTYQLDTNHQYYYQIQAQLFICEKKYCDFYVWTGKDFFLQRISPNEIFFNEAVANISKVFKIGILPELLAKCTSHSS